MRLLTLLGCFAAFAAAAAPLACPDIKDLSLVNGEYAWQSKNSLWEGFFAHPATGIGKSSEVEAFIEARWIQLNQLNHPQGIVECDYAGNVPHEVIRFVNAQSGPKPKDLTWSCSFNPIFPSTQCVCSGDPAQCMFEKS